MRINDKKNTTLPIFFTILALALAGLACQALEADNPVISGTSVPATNIPEAGDDAASASDSPPVVTIPGPVVESSATLPDPIQPRGPGMACFGLRAGGLSCLDENGWQTFTRDNSGLPSNFVQAGGICPDERIVIAHASGLSLFDGANWENIPETRNYSTANAVACAPDGSLWVAHFRGVSTYSNGQWTTYAADYFSSGETASELVYDIAALPDGRIWALTARSVAVFENGEWEIFQQGHGFSDSVFFDTLIIDSLGRPWASLSRGITVYDGEWQFVGRPGYGSSSSMAFDASGKLWVGGASNGVSVFNGNTWVDFNRRLGTLPSDRVQDIAADSKGRVWVATTYGLVVLYGDQRQVYRMHNSEIGDNELRFIVVIKDGPTMPEVEERDTGSLAGKLERVDGTSLVGIKVEICVESLLKEFSGDSPCSDQPYFLFTLTNANGEFLFENVPAGYYVFAAETDDGWTQLTTQFGIISERTLILPGQHYDIGTLTLGVE